MSKFYSAKTGAFYAVEIHGNRIPGDAVEISDEYHRELIDGQSADKMIGADSKGRPVLVDVPLEPLNERKAKAKQAIDIEAGNARQRFVSDGQFQAEEYLQAEQSTQAWVDAGKPGDAVPGDVQAWADASGMSPSDAADDILATATRWRSMITHIRQIRLTGKAAVDAAEDQDSANDMAAVAAPFIDQLKAVKP